MKRELAFPQWLLICVLLVWPLNFFFSHTTTTGNLTATFTVHGAWVGAIVALVSAARDLRRAQALKAGAPAESWPRFGATVASHWPWLLGLLPLLLHVRWNQSFTTTSRLAGGEIVKKTESTVFGWGHDASFAFAVLVALALLAHVWRWRVEAAVAV